MDIDGTDCDNVLRIPGGPCVVLPLKPKKATEEPGFLQRAGGRCVILPASKRKVHGTTQRVSATAGKHSSTMAGTMNGIQSKSASVRQPPPMIDVIIFSFNIYQLLGKKIMNNIHSWSNRVRQWLGIFLFSPRDIWANSSQFYDT